MAEPSPSSSFLRPSFLRQLGQYFALILRQASEDSVLLTASALAWVTILSLIPLLTAFSLIGARVFHQSAQPSLEVFVEILPYSEETVVEKIGEFMEQAETLHGYGAATFLATALLAFFTVEETLNRMWNVTRRRKLHVRLLSFLLFLFWAPLLIGVTFSSLILLRQTPALRRLFEQSFLFNLMPLLVAIAGLTLLYWRVPYTTVRFRNALAGGLLAAILLEMIRQGFASYVQFFRGVNAVYGSFAFALLFMISLELTWGIVLLGSEAAYTAQHFRVLSRGLHRHPPVDASWVGLAALVLIARRLSRGEPLYSLNALADRLSLPTLELDRILHPLLTRNLLRSLGEKGYVLATDPHRLPVDRVLAAYDHRAVRSAELTGGELQTRLEALIGDLAHLRGERLGELTVGDLIGPLAAPRPPEYNTGLPQVGQ